MCTETGLFLTLEPTFGAKVGPRAPKAPPKEPKRSPKASPGPPKTMEKATWSPTWPHRVPQEAPGTPPGTQNDPKTVKTQLFHRTETRKNRDSDALATIPLCNLNMKT